MISFNSFMTEVPIKKKPVANQWTGFYMVGFSFMKELEQSLTNS